MNNGNKQRKMDNEQRTLNSDSVTRNKKQETRNYPSNFSNSCTTLLTGKPITL